MARRQYLFPLQVSGPVITAHTSDMDDPAAPIWTDGRAVLIPPGGQLEGRCRHCVAKVTIARDGDLTWQILAHQPGCKELSRWRQLAREVPR